MLFRTSISTTKKFFKKTLKTFKSFLSGGYERLPKTPAFKPFSCSDDIDTKFTQNYKELDKFYSEFSNRWDTSTKDEEKKLASPTSNYKEQRSDEYRMSKRTGYEEKGKAEDLWRTRNAREGGSGLVAEKLKELEMMDRSNVEHVLDIEEVLHYYSRLTCPAYLDIVDKFFMDMYAELKGSSTHGHRSRPMQS